MKASAFVAAVTRDSLRWSASTTAEAAQEYSVSLAPISTYLSLSPTTFVVARAALEESVRAVN